MRCCTPGISWSLDEQSKAMAWSASREAGGGPDDVDDRVRDAVRLTPRRPWDVAGYCFQVQTRAFVPVRAALRSSGNAPQRRQQYELLKLARSDTRSSSAKHVADRAGRCDSSRTLAGLKLIDLY